MGFWPVSVVMLRPLRSGRGLPRKEYVVEKLCGREKTEQGVEDARDMYISEVSEWPPGHMGCHGTYPKAGEDHEEMFQVTYSDHSMGIDKCTS